jgi:hypothetical protein
MRVSLVIVSIAVGVAGTLLARSVLAEEGAVDAVTVRSAGEQEAVKIVANRLSGVTSSTTFVTATSASITIPAGHADLVIVDLVAESTCRYTGAPTTAGGDCRVIMRIGSVELLPDDNSVLDIPWVPDSTAVNDEYHAMTRFVCLNGGAAGKTYRIFVDYRVSGAPMEFTLDDWTLKLTRSHGCATS